MTLPELAIRRHVTTLMIIVSLVVLGGVALFRLPLAFLPDIEEPELFVHVSYPQASPEQIEQMIARPLEDAVGSVKGLKTMWSRCGDDGVRMRLGFDWGADLHLARVEIWERIDRIRQGELSGEGAVYPLAATVLPPCLLCLTVALAADGEHTIIQRDIDSLARNAGDVCLQDIAFCFLTNVNGRCPVVLDSGAACVAVARQHAIDLVAELAKQPVGLVAC